MNRVFPVDGATAKIFFVSVAGKKFAGLGCGRAFVTRFA
jgi:hypothetical protein